GGGTWQAGQRISSPIGSLAVSKSHPNVIYAGEGVADEAPESRLGSGILKSVDGGKSWGIAGNSGTVLANSKISKIVIDPNNDQIIYAGVAYGGTSGPGVYKSSDGGKTWTNILTPATMVLAGGSNVPAGTALASVTDIVLDPFDPNHQNILVGLGHIGLVGTSRPAGVWFSSSGGTSFSQVVGGKGRNGYSIANSTLPTGTGVGVVKIAMSSGRIGNEGTVYVLVGTVPGSNTPPNVDLGGYSGLYKTSDGLNNFTKVMLKQNVGGTQPLTNPHNFQDINFGKETSYATAPVADPTN